ncbi:Down syndrome cell adhesion molecule-like protein Dscam2 [Limulus polyphemus]|uniref:Down syndrome cell adhesion molecule-like protein Dscam2 n=1 Tax=Limulus polyphemus TaxID=6850 RepID=A0ABM1TA78_LIMPO|nr:Down syndrome cell adhesion molecule-like protein Dscam2 [Limulus polyphemus]
MIIWKKTEQEREVSNFFFGFLMVVVKEVLSTSDYRAPLIDVEPPSKLTFLNTSGASLHCSASGNPIPDVYWIITDGTKVTDLPGLRVSMSNGTLLFPPFQSENYRQDVHSTLYRCVASNSLGKVGSRDVQVRAVIHQNYEVQVYNEFVTRGNTAILRCYIPIFIRDYVTVTTWERDDGITIVSNVANGGRFSVLSHGELHIRNTTDKDGFKGYYCRTTHTLNGESHLSQNSGKLIITEPQTNQMPRLSETRTVYSVQQGEPVELTCAAAQAYPLPTYHWYKKDGANIIPVLLNGNIIQVGGSLYIRKTSVRDGGTYVCLVKNNVGQKRMETHLTVTVPLRAKLTPERLLVNAGRSATVTCNVSGFPINTVKWVKDQRPLTPDGMKFRLLTRDSLHVSSVGREDKGIYQCYVSNKDDSAQAALELVLEETAPVLLETFIDQTLKPGPSVSLHCTATGTPLPQVTWSLDGYPVPDNDRVRVGDYVSRSGSVVSFVNISNVQVEDGGSYECIARNDVGSMRHFARLNVVGNPIVKPMPVKVIVSGENGVLQCRVAGYPIENIFWEKDGRLLPVNRRQIVFPNGTVFIQEVQKTKDDGVYTCTATSDQGNRASGDVEVKVKLKPVVLPFIFPVNIENGMKLSAVCSVAAGDPPINVSWLKDGAPLVATNDITIKTLSEDSMLLAIDKVGLQHSGDYTCVASNDAGAVNLTRPLSVHVPPSWRIEPKDASVIVGHSITLDCQADGFPPPRVRWEKAKGIAPIGYHPITTSYHYQIFENGSLTIQDVTKDDEGYYLCQATNGNGSEMSGVVTLKVHVAPKFRKRFQTQMIPKNKSATLDCSVIGDQPIKITWLRDKQPIAFDLEPRVRKSEVTSSGMLKSQVTVTSVGRSDSALYTCMATNDYGSDESNVQLIVQEPPDPPREIHAADTTSRSTRIHWDPPFSGNSPIIYYTVYWQRTRKITSSEANHRVLYNTTIPSTDISTRVNFLKPATTYEVYVTAENVIGVSGPSKKVSFTTEAETPAGPPQSIIIESVTSEALRVSWLPPLESVRNGVIQGYYVGYKKTNSSESYQYKTVEAKSNENTRIKCDLQGLRKFTFYTVVVQAFNEKGAGPRSDAIIGRTYEDVPTAPPGNVNCVPVTSQSITVTWTSPPETSINGKLKGYKVFCRPATLFYEGLVSPFVVKDDTTTTTLYDLEKYTNYSLAVVAFTREGEGVASQPVYCRTLSDVPSAPADIKAIPMLSNGILVSWRRPAQPNGVIQQYTLYKRWLSQGRQDTISNRVEPSETHFEVLNLENNKRYEFWVTASTVIGEGESTRVLSQRTSETIPARIASFPEHVTVSSGSEVHLPCLAVGIPTPYREWTFSLISLHFLISNIFLLIYILQTPTGLPAPTDLTIGRATSSSIQMSWNMDLRFKPALTEYLLRYKRDFGQWEIQKIPPSATSFTLNNLSCGTRYFIQLVAIGMEGEGNPSNVLSTRTEGGAPSPPSREIFIVSNSTYVTLHMNAWDSGGCPITSFIIRYKRIYTNDWKMTTTDIGRHLDHVTLQELTPGTWYNLRITAHNSAGSSVKEYSFSTLTSDGATIAPVAIGGYLRPDKPWEELNIIIPIVAAAIALTVVLGVAICVCVKRRQSDEMYERNRLNSRAPVMMLRGSQKKVQDQVQYQEVATYQRAPKIQRSARNEPALERDQVLPLPDDHDHSTGYEDDLAPYATFRLPGCDSDTESSQGTVRELQTFGNQYQQSFVDPPAQYDVLFHVGLKNDMLYYFYFFFENSTLALTTF